MPEYDIALELARLHILKGADFVRQLKMLTQLSIFKPVDNEKDIYVAEGGHRDDFPSLLDAARKAVAHGNAVYILPNPKGIRTADFIFESKGVYKMYDLKTIRGKSSVIDRLVESIGQTNHVLLHIMGQYNSNRLAIDIRTYFEQNPNAVEVLVFKSKRVISIKRSFVSQKTYLVAFRKKYEK